MELYISLYQTFRREGYRLIAIIESHANEDNSEVGLINDVLGHPVALLFRETVFSNKTEHRDTVHAECLERTMHAARALAYPGRQQFLWNQLIVTTLIDTSPRPFLRLRASTIFPGASLAELALVGIEMRYTTWHLQLTARLGLDRRLDDARQVTVEALGNFAAIFQIVP